MATSPKSTEESSRGAKELTAKELAFFLCWFSTLLLGAFMVVTPFLRPLIGNASMVWLAGSLWPVWIIYLGIQFNETAVRPSAEMGRFAIDNLGALGALIIGLFIMWSPVFEVYPVEEWSIMKQATAVTTLDLLWGVITGFRIALAGKERDETKEKG